MSLENEERNSAYEKLTPQRKQLVDKVMENLEKGNLFWSQGWVSSGAPESAVTGKKYRGINNLFLSLIAMSENYEDNRWATFKQMEEKGWTFKKDEEGKSAAKGKGATVEYYEMRDKETKKRFDRSVLDGMTASEQQEYMDKNVYWLRKFYRVFNCSLMDGVPAKEKPLIDINDRNERAEAILLYWDQNESKIVYGGSQAYYKASSDEVHLPKRADFKSMQEFYSTALHEIGHSTGHETRLNRDLSGGFGSEKYAMEELRAEIASIFMEQDVGIEASEGRLQNNAAYLQSWKEEIKENPNALFTAITDADKIAKYVSERERAYRRVNDVQYYSIIEETNAYSEQVYKCCICDEEGEVKPLINYAFADREALEKEIDKVKELDLWKDKTFEEVSIEELKEKGKAGKVEQEKSTEYIKPSELVATEVAAKALPVSMKGRGSESLTRMSDRETLARAEGYYAKDSKFADLYVGKNVMKNIERSESGLMLRLAMFCGNDEEQLLRIFKSSGQFRDEKPNAYYMKLASESIELINNLAVEAYARKGIYETTDCTGLNAEDFPLFTDLLAVLREKNKEETDSLTLRDMRTAELYLQKFVSGRYSDIWNAPSTLKVDADLIDFNFQSLFANKNNTVANAQMLLVFRFIEQEVINAREANKSGKNLRTLIISDEAHLFIDAKFPIALDFFFSMSKRIRKYNGSFIPATQNIISRRCS